MSIKILNHVWQYSKSKGSTLLLLLAIADNAREENAIAWPGIEYLSEKTRLSERQVIRIIQKSEELGELKVRRSKSGNTYMLNVWPPEGPTINYCENCGVVEDPRNDIFTDIHHIIPKSQGGKDNPENLIRLCKSCHNKEHNLSYDNLSYERDDIFKVTLSHPKVTSEARGSDIAMSYKPLLNRKHEPSNGTVNKDPIPDGFDIPDFLQAWADFKEHRKQIKKKMSDIAISRMLKKLGKYPVKIAIQMLDTSIENSWQGVFEPKGYVSNKNPDTDWKDEILEALKDE